jgi:hypothetical protein
LEDPGLGGRTTLKYIFRKWDVVGMDWIDLAQNRDRWWTLVNAVMNFGYHTKRKISLLAGAC